MMQSMMRVGVTALLLAWASAAQAVSIEMRPGGASVPAGSTSSIEVWADGLVNEYIGGYDISVLFDRSLVAFGSETFGTGLDGPADSLQIATPREGSVNMYEVSFSGLFNQDGTTAFRLFTLNFDTLLAGVAGFTFESVLVTDELGFDLLSTLVGTSVTITEREPTTGVPEPGTFALLALGLMGLGVSRRRKAST